MQDISKWVFQGKPRSEIARLCNVTPNTIQKWAEKQGVLELLKANGKLSQGGVIPKDKVDKAINLVKERKTLKEISSELGVSSTTIKNWVTKFAPELLPVIKQTGRKAKGRQKVTDKEIQLMLKYSAQGMGVDLIGKKLGYDGTTIMRYLRKELGDKEYEKRHNKKKFTTYWSGRYYKNDRGDILQSSLEEIVADFLFDNGIKYTTHSELMCGDKKYFPDFKLTDYEVYIEVLGMTDLDFYNIKTEKKKADYQQYNVKCIYLEKKDFRNLEPILRKELEKYEIT